MALYIKCRDPRELLSEIYRKIDVGLNVSWKYDGDGDFYYEETSGKCWLRPRVSGNSKLVMDVVLPDFEDGISLMDYSICCGRFVEMILLHFYDVDSVRLKIELSD